MSVPFTDVESPLDSENGPRAGRSRWRRHLSVTVVTLVILAAFLGTGWSLYNRPAHTFSVGANDVRWTSDVKLAISESTPVGPIHPSGPLRDLPGVGRIVSVVVEKGSRHRVIVLFLTSEGWNESGLVYLNGYAPPSDSCNVHLSGPWWQVGPMNVATMSCARGFNYTPGG
jgi:hypothetical protein